MTFARDVPASSAAPGQWQARPPAAVRVVGRHHRVVGLEPEALSVFGWRQIVSDHQVAPECLPLLATDQTDKVIRAGRSTYRYRRLGPLLRRLLRLGAGLAELACHGGYQRGEVCHGDLVFRDISRHNLGRDFGQ
jgi:hypothetical protein